MLGRTVKELEETMPFEEWLEWSEFLKYRHEKEKKAREKARAEAKAKRGKRR